MLLDTNIKAIIALVLVSLLALASHRLGFLDTSLSLTNGSHINDFSHIDVGNSKGVFVHKDGVLNTLCTLNDTDGFNLCGVSIGLDKEGPQNGLDLSGYDRLELNVALNAPLEHSKLKISFRNYHEAYAEPDDFVSLKFNTIVYNPALHTSPLMVPLQAFQVENWWLSQYQINFNHSQTDFSNVSYIEFLTVDMPETGTYEVIVNNAVLRGQLLTEIDVLKLVFLLWLAAVIALMTRQRNQLKVIAVTDPLTECYNRRGIQQWITNALPKYDVCLFHFDINDFKKINDTYGHARGDELLIQLAHRVKEHIFSLHDNKVVLARLSSDEFLLAFRNLDSSDIGRMAQEFFIVLQEPFDLSGNKLIVNASLGIAPSLDKTDTFEDLTIRADSATYYAKRNSTVKFKIFDESVSKEIYFRKQIAEKLKNALVDDQFKLNFMPIYNGKSLQIEAVEVLLRCHADSLTGIGPDVFIPIAEEFNLIKSIDLWVIESTFKKMNKERALLQESPLTFCINISSEELHNTSFSGQLHDLLKKYQIDPKWIELEITETSLIKIDERCIRILKEIRALGVSLALDDFGTGYTAFNQLIYYPIDCLKIDKSFIDSLSNQNATYESMIRAILFIAKSYKLTSIGEGIETVEQYQYLLENGCDMMQGYLFAKPMDWGNLKQLLLYPRSEELQRKLSTN